MLRGCFPVAVISSELSPPGRRALVRIRKCGHETRDQIKKGRDHFCVYPSPVGIPTWSKGRDSGRVGAPNRDGKVHKLHLVVASSFCTQHAGPWRHATCTGLHFVACLFGNSREKTSG